MERIELKHITEDVKQAAHELLDASCLKPGQILVLGCSSSEVLGQRMGKAPSMEIAEAIYQGIFPEVINHRVCLAVQGCEHINRALVVEEECADKYGLEVVSVVPFPGAGGAMAASAYYNFKNPVMVEKISAHAGMDIGDTFIGMHLKRVAVSVPSSIKTIGKAHLTMARSRPILIGGERARYTGD